jgi:putative transposase
MARLGRYFLPEQPLHVIQRGNDWQAVFFSDEDRVLYLGWLLAAAREHGCAIHAYVLMTNHVHLLLTPARADSLPRLMQSLGRRYVRYVNDAHRRTGTLWEGRYRAAPIDSEAYLLACCRYIELNPMRARMVRSPRDYRWSSYRANALGAADPLVRPHALYLTLGRSGGTPIARCSASGWRKSSSRICARPPMAAGRSATKPSSAASPRPPGAAPSPCPRAARA